MAFKLFVFFFSLFLMDGCRSPADQSNVEGKRKLLSAAKKSKKLTHVSIKPVFGYRFVIVGDFDGDGKQDTLTEHFVSAIDNKETNKFYENASYDTMVTLTCKKKPKSFLTCSNKKIKSLMVDTGKQQFGLSWLKNEGDLDGKGSDELSYVVNNSDWSSINFCVVMAFRKASGAGCILSRCVIGCSQIFRTLIFNTTLLGYRGEMSIPRMIRQKKKRNGSLNPLVG